MGGLGETQYAPSPPPPPFTDKFSIIYRLLIISLLHLYSCRIFAEFKVKSLCLLLWYNELDYTELYTTTKWLLQHNMDTNILHYLKLDAIC